MATFMISSQSLLKSQGPPGVIREMHIEASLALTPRLLRDALATKRLDFASQDRCLQFSRNKEFLILSYLN